MMYLYFLLGFIITFVLIKMFSPKPKTILITPTLQNYKSTIYIDDNGKEYRYDLISVHE